MYRTVAIDVWIAVLAVVAADVLCRIVIRGNHQPAGTQKSSTPLLRFTRILINVSGLVCFAAAAITGFWNVFTGSATLTGYRLLAHVAAAPVFVALSILIALFWSHSNQFSASAASTFSNRSGWLRKIFFWTALALLVPTILSIITAMFPFSTPAQQDLLFRIHRYCALPMAAAGSLFVYFGVVSWRGRTES